MNHRRCKQTSHAKSRYGNWPTSGTEKQTNKQTNDTNDTTKKEQTNVGARRSETRFRVSFRNFDRNRIATARSSYCCHPIRCQQTPTSTKRYTTIVLPLPPPPLYPGSDSEANWTEKKPNKPSPRLRRSTRTSHAEQTKQVGRRRSLLIESETVVTPRCDEASVRN